MNIKDLLEQFDNFIGNSELGEKEGQTTEDLTGVAAKKEEKKEEVSESVSARLIRELDSINEISDKTVNRVYNRRQIDASKASANFDKEGDIEAINKADRNKELVRKRDERKKCESKMNEISDRLKNKVAAKRQIEGEKLNKEENEIARKFGADSKEYKDAHERTNRAIKKLNKFDRHSKDIINSKEYQDDTEGMYASPAGTGKLRESKINKTSKRLNNKNESKLNEISKATEKRVLAKRFVQNANANYGLDSDDERFDWDKSMKSNRAEQNYINKAKADLTDKLQKKTDSLRVSDQEERDIDYKASLRYGRALRAGIKDLANQGDEEALKYQAEKEKRLHPDVIKEAQQALTEISKEIVDDVHAKRQLNALKAEIKDKQASGEEKKETEKKLDKALDKADKNDKLTRDWKKAKGIKEDAEDSLLEATEELIYIGFDKLAPYKPAVVSLVKKIMNKLVEKGLVEAYDYGKGKGKYRSVDSVEEEKGGFDEYRKFLAEETLKEPDLKKAIEKRLAKKLKESVKPKRKAVKKLKESVVATYDNGKHEIVKNKDGYFCKYNIKEGKARFTTASVKNLPTAVSALKKKFPKAEEDK